MAFSVGKCEVMHFGSNNPCHDYLLQNSVLATVKSTVDLGITVADNLKPSNHCIKIVKSASAYLNVIKRCFGPMDKPTFLPLYKGLVRSRLETASSAWNPHLLKDILLLEKVQRKATRLVSGLADRSYDDRLRFLGLQTLETRRHRQDLIIVYKLMHGYFDFDWRRLFELDVSCRTRGHPLKLRRITTPSRDYARYFFNYRIIDSWNRLPSPVVTAQSLRRFKSLLHGSGCLPEL